MESPAVSTLYEILELPDGDVVLQRVDGDEDPLVRIRFSNQARAYMQEGNIEVARAMVEAGIRAMSRISEGRENDEGDAADQPHQLH
jgi:hypothetical protein